MRLLDRINTQVLLGESVYVISTTYGKTYITSFTTYCFKLPNGDVLQTKINPYANIVLHIISRTIDFNSKLKINYNRWKG